MMNTATKRLRIVTAASLFDGHDAAINIMRRIMQAKGAEIIHLGHNRSVHEIVEAAIEEDADAIAITSYQGGHVEFFKYMKDLLNENGSGHIQIFGGGGGTILPEEINELHAYGITRIYSPDDGRHMGLEGMIEDLLAKSAVREDGKPANGANKLVKGKNGYALGESKNILAVAKAITQAEEGVEYTSLLSELNNTAVSAGSRPAGEKVSHKKVVLGITGTGGAGKSSVTDEIVRRFLQAFPSKNIAVVSVDPSRKKTGGALLGDRIRMNSISSPRAYMRSLATRESDVALSAYVKDALNIVNEAGYDLIILESAGVGQSDASILDYCDVSLYVMTPEYGAASQLEKINMLDYADIIAINKFDKAGALDALQDVRKQYKRNHNKFTAKDNELPIVGTIANRFNDGGVNTLFDLLIKTIKEKSAVDYGEYKFAANGSLNTVVIPSSRVRYLAEIAERNRTYDAWVKEQSNLASQWYQLAGASEIVQQSFTTPRYENLGLSEMDEEVAHKFLAASLENIKQRLSPECLKLIEQWPSVKHKYEADFFEYRVRDRVIRQELAATSLSGTRIPKLVLPSFKDWGDILRWQLQENVPGEFPYTAGVFELKRTGEDPTRMFAGEGCPERTNKRFHYVSLGQPAKRLSTAFDSVTLYGENPDHRPDIYGKVGNSGVSIATIDDAKKLYSGFDLCDAKTSVSMTINGPAPIILAFFMNAAIDQLCEKWIEANGLWHIVHEALEKKYATDPMPVYHNIGASTGLQNLEGVLPEGNNGLGLRLLGLSGDEVVPADIYKKLKAEALSNVRGTVQADILKEDQAQNTCIFSTEFALKLMGDVQEYFINNKVRNFYSVSISGYHIAEAGANPITQLAFTLANGFTYVEYYLSRGMHIDDFAPNLSFFFSNGMDPEYSVIGRVARRIWAKAMKYKYNGNDRSQKLKYHIQTSGRSLHAQEIDFNDIRTTLQALYAIYDNCNSLHTNAYDEAITTPTEESVRRAMAIQLIINRELGSVKTENYLQGSFAVEELTDLVEEAVLQEFERISERGGVLGAMERMYQRNKIQEESLYYETLKHTGELPIIGVNTFLNKTGSATVIPLEVIRSTREEKSQQIENLVKFHKRNEKVAAAELMKLKEAAVNNGNLFEQLMETAKFCSLGQITHALYEVGGQYRRNM
ncbi:methylmalonyl-CoA mutase family protein [Danxiaibacter flavus]|uniref:Fused isobutyryl-CoA mutase n=1 Tax=Danxiaibacter flavus TaxID=3049108 RepID=A0ABV3ZPC7_9BACT|nr:methylmalonyl-CoA mutase family protein [Chitinophagaceae bacterium DXS]